MRQRASTGAIAVVLLMAAAYAALFTSLAFIRHDTFNTWALDTGNMDQAVWNTIHGRPFAFTNMEGITSRLAIHVEPILLLIAPLYLLWSDPKALFLLQSAALASGALPVFYLARNELKSDGAGIALAATYLLFPSLQAINMAEFHPVALSTPLLLWAFYFAATGRWPGYVLASLAAAGTKEEVGLVVGCMGLYLAISRRSLVPALVAAAGFLWSILAVLVVIPAFNPVRASPYAGYYRYLGEGMMDKALGLLAQPWLPLQRIWGDPEYISSLLAPTCLLSLLAPERLLTGVTSLMINVLSDNDLMHRPNDYHYSAPLIPAIMLATIRGTARARSLLWYTGLRSETALAILIALLLVSSGLYQKLEGLTPLGSRFIMPAMTERDMIGHEVLKLVPPEAPLSVQTELNPHLSQREKLYVFPTVNDAEFVLADRLRDPGAMHNRPTWLHLRRMEELDSLLTTGGFSVILDQDGYVLLERTAGGGRP